MFSYYDEIPFDELSAEDPDFRFLMDYRDGLELLGDRLEALIARSARNNLQASDEWDEYTAAITLTEDLFYKGQKYRSEILVRAEDCE